VKRSGDATSWWVVTILGTAVMEMTYFYNGWQLAFAMESPPIGNDVGNVTEAL